MNAPDLPRQGFHKHLIRLSFRTSQSRSLLILTAVLGLAGCRPDQGQTEQSSAKGIPTSLAEPSSEPPTISIATRNAPTTYYIDRDGEPTGFEYELAKDFANTIGKEPRFVVYDTVDEIIRALLKGEVDFAAAGLAHTEDRKILFPFGPEYQSVDQLVVCHRSAAVRELDDLIGKNLVFTAQSSYEEKFKKLKASIPALEWTSAHDRSTEELMQEVNDNQYDCVAVDSNIFDANRHLYESLQLGFTLSQTQLAWPINPNFPSLKTQMMEWFHSDFRRETIHLLYEKYYGYLGEYDPYDIHVFKNRIETRLPRYKKIIADAADANDLDFSLLAAIAYQESHWDPHSISPTGVRGFMMLTLPTAKAFGASQRTNAKQSIEAGARYLKHLHDRFPSFLQEDDRTWFTLASYNVGYYHVQDARRLAIGLNKNPNAWKDIKTVLPLLSNRKYYKKTKYGYARGQEPVQYVRNIRNYRLVLESVLGLNNSVPVSASH